MGPKPTDTRVDVMEKELEEVKTNLQRLPVLEKTMEQLSQGLSQMFQSMEETQRAIASLTAATLHSNRGKSPEVFTGQSTPRSKVPEAPLGQRQEAGKWVPNVEEGS